MALLKNRLLDTLEEQDYPKVFCPNHLSGEEPITSENVLVFVRAEHAIFFSKVHSLGV